MYVRELERYAKDGREFSFFAGRSIHELDYALIEGSAQRRAAM